MDASPVLERLEALRPRRGFTLVGVGGHGCAGKTTLAHAIPGATVVGTDEFWNGSSFELDRVRRDVLDPLVQGREARFRSFDWAAQAERPDERTVRPEGVVVIDGVCALHRMFRDDYDLRVWVEAPYDVRLARAVERDGEEKRAVWVERWIPGEERYVASDDPVSAADVIVRGG